MYMGYPADPLLARDRQACEDMLTPSLFPSPRGSKNFNFEASQKRGDGLRPVFFELRIIILIQNYDYAIVGVLPR